MRLLAELPDGTELIAAVPIKASIWSSAASLNVRYPDGADDYFFLKTAVGDRGRIMIEGEFNSMKELYGISPDMVPKPHSQGLYEMDGCNVYFFLSEYIPISDQLPEPTQLCSKIAKLHKESQSPTGKFGFHVTTCQGSTPQFVDWEENWTVFLTSLLQSVLDLHSKTIGIWNGLNRLAERLISVVIPRLLDPLSTDGRSLKPSLIHGDLWEGNTGTALKNGNIYVSTRRSSTPTARWNPAIGAAITIKLQIPCILRHTFVTILQVNPSPTGRTGTVCTVSTTTWYTLSTTWERVLPSVNCE